MRNRIDEYRLGGEKLALAVRGLTVNDLAAFPNPDDNVGRWSIQQVVIHVLDSDLVLADRMKRVIAEESPTLTAFDENKWVQNLHYELQPVAEAVELLDKNRQYMARILEVLPDSAWKRTGLHTERGPLDLSTILGYAIDHIHHHVKFINAKREKLGKLMW